MTETQAAIEALEVAAPVKLLDRAWGVGEVIPAETVADIPRRNLSALIAQGTLRVAGTGSAELSAAEKAAARKVAGAKGKVTKADNVLDTVRKKLAITEDRITMLQEDRRKFVLGAAQGEEAHQEALSRLDQDTAQAIRNRDDLRLAVEQAEADVAKAEENLEQVEEDARREVCAELAAERAKLAEEIEEHLDALVKAFERLDTNGREIIARTHHSNQLSSHWRVQDVLQRYFGRWLTERVSPIQPNGLGFAAFEAHLVEQHLKRKQRNANGSTQVEN